MGMSILFQATETMTQGIAGNVGWFIAGIVLLIGAIIVWHFLKNVIANTVLGLAGWGILVYVLHIDLPFWPSLIISAIFGLAGLGAMLVLSFMGIIV